MGIHRVSANPIFSTIYGVHVYIASPFIRHIWRWQKIQQSHRSLDIYVCVHISTLKRPYISKKAYI
jgi:hypothetical protein